VLTSPSSEEELLAAVAFTSQTDSPASDDSGLAARALPRRIAGSSLTAMDVRTAQPLADPALLRRVLDGLKRL
jgi:hypothetical protein